jgi:hypothetical protein
MADTINPAPPDFQAGHDKQVPSPSMSDSLHLAAAAHHAAADAHHTAASHLEDAAGALDDELDDGREPDADDTEPDADDTNRGGASRAMPRSAQSRAYSFPAGSGAARTLSAATSGRR